MSLLTHTASLAAALRPAADSTERSGTAGPPGVFAGLLQERNQTAQRQDNPVPTGTGRVASPEQGFRPTLAKPPAPATAPPTAVRRAEARVAEQRGTESRQADSRAVASHAADRGNEARGKAARADARHVAEARTEANRAQARRAAAADTQRRQHSAGGVSGHNQSGDAPSDTGSSDHVGASHDTDAELGDGTGATTPAVAVDPAAPVATVTAGAACAADTGAATAATLPGPGNTAPGGDAEAGATSASAAATASVDGLELATPQRLLAGHDGAGAPASASTSATDGRPGAASRSADRVTEAALRPGGDSAAAHTLPRGPAADATHELARPSDPSAQPGGALADAATSFASALVGATASAAQPTTLAPESPANVTAQVHVPVESPGFGSAVMLQVGRLAADGTQQATLNLNPAELGPIQIHIALDGQQASVDFGAAHGRTRELLEAALHDLAAALQADGLNLAQTHVGEMAPAPVERTGAMAWNTPGADSPGSGASARADAGPGGHAGGGQSAGQGGSPGGAYTPGTTAMGGERSQRLAGLGWAQPGSTAGATPAGGARVGLDLYA